MMIWGPWHFGGGAAVGLIGMVIFWALVVGGIVLVVRAARGAGGGRDAAPPGGPYPGPYGRPDPLQVLDERFARGEIDADEYRARRDILRERHDQPPGA